MEWLYQILAVPALALLCMAWAGIHLYSSRKREGDPKPDIEGCGGCQSRDSCESVEKI